MATRKLRVATRDDSHTAGLATHFEVELDRRTIEIRLSSCRDIDIQSQLWVELSALQKNTSHRHRSSLKIISPRLYYQYRCDRQSRTTHLILSKGTLLPSDAHDVNLLAIDLPFHLLVVAPVKKTFRFDIVPVGVASALAEEPLLWRIVDRGLEPSKGARSHWRKPNGF